MYSERLSEYGLAATETYAAFKQNPQLEQAVMDSLYDALLENPITAGHTQKKIDLYNKQVA